MSTALVHRSQAYIVVKPFGYPLFRGWCPGCGMPGVGFQPGPSEICGECTRKRTLADAPDRGYWLYRIWRDDRLLYVGVTVNPRARLRSHWRRWWGFITDVTWEECEDELDMLKREARAIGTENPAFNDQHPDF